MKRCAYQRSVIQAQGLPAHSAQTFLRVVKAKAGLRFALPFPSARPRGSAGLSARATSGWIPKSGGAPGTRPCGKSPLRHAGAASSPSDLLQRRHRFASGPWQAKLPTQSPGLCALK